MRGRGKLTLQQLLKGMPNKFDILDPDGDDEEDDGKSAVEEEDTPGDRKNPSDRGVESVTVGQIRTRLLHIKEKFAKKNRIPNKEALVQLVKDFSDSFDISMRSTSTIEEHTPMVPLMEAADPSATDSVTRLGQCSAQDDLDHERSKSAAQLTKKMADDEMAYEAEDFDRYREYWESAWSKSCGFFEYKSE
jgi:hypothetical protein